MRSAGLTNESALLGADIERFFALAAPERSPTKSVVLEDSEAPAPIIAKMNAVLASTPVDLQQQNHYLDGGNYATFPGKVRRVRPMVLAVSLGRNAKTLPN